MHFGWIKTGVMFWLLSRPREEIKTRPFVLTLAPTCARPRLKCAWLSSDEAPSFKFDNPKSAEGFFFSLFYKWLWEHTFCELGRIYIMFWGIEGNVTLQRGLICNDYNVYSNVRRQQSQTILPSGCNSSKPKVYKRPKCFLMDNSLQGSLGGSSRAGWTVSPCQN